MIRLKLKDTEKAYGVVFQETSYCNSMGDIKTGLRSDGLQMPGHPVSMIIFLRFLTVATARYLQLVTLRMP